MTKKLELTREEIEVITKFYSYEGGAGDKSDELEKKLKDFLAPPTTPSDADTIVIVTPPDLGKADAYNFLSGIWLIVVSSQKYSKEQLSAFDIKCSNAGNIFTYVEADPHMEKTVVIIKDLIERRGKIG